MSEIAEIILFDATEGECWYCYAVPREDTVFSWEFDTYVHLSCIQNRVEAGLSEYDPELAIFAREFGLTVTQEK